MDITSYLLGKKAGGGGGGANLQTKSITISTNTTTNVKPDKGYDGLSQVNVTTNMPEPTGNINITTTNQTNVKDYATAQVVDADLVAGNIKKDVNILGVVGTYEGSGGASLDLTTGIRFGGSTFSTLPTIIQNANWEDVIYMDAMFSECNNLTSIPQLDISNVAYMGNAFTDCTSLTTIPLLNTSNVQDMGSVFYFCERLTIVPQLDTSNVVYMDYAFGECPNLSEQSLNNILAMCANVSNAYTGEKTLMAIGLSEEQAETCTGLSNYNTFLSAGWTTGYDTYPSYTLNVDLAEIESLSGTGNLYDVGYIDSLLYSNLYQNKTIKLVLNDSGNTITGIVTPNSQAGDVKGSFISNDEDLEFTIYCYEEEEEDPETGEFYPTGNYLAEFQNIQYNG